VPKVLNLTLVARNQYGTTKKRNVMLTEAATPVVPTTVASTTTTPLTTAAPAPSTQCTGPCKFTFPAVDFNGIMSIQLNAVTQGVPCPDNSDPYFDECDASASQQLDDVNISVCAGSQGSLDVSGVTGDLSLDLTNATQASKDSVTNDSSVPTAFGNYGAVAPGQCITGDVYFDVTSGAQWQSLNYAYRSADFQSQTVYVWTS
jgi:hypothetical protein